MDQRRLLLAFALSLLLLTLYQELVIRRYHRPPGEPAPTSQPQEQPATAPAVPPRQPGPDLGAPAATEGGVVVQTDVFRVRITPVGARVADLELVSYRRSVDADSEPLDVVTAAPILPLTLRLADQASDASVVYQPDRPSLTVHGDGQGEVVFTGQSPDGLRIEKRYQFKGEGYLFELKTSLSGAAVPPAVGVVLTPIPLDAPTGRETGIALADRRFVEKKVTDFQKQDVRLDTGVAWGGFAAQYFVSAAVPRTPAAVIMSSADGFPLITVQSKVQDGRAEFDVYAGPRDREILSSAGHDLDRAVDFGWFWFIALPLLRALRALHTITGNYGVAIIVLTTLVKLVTVPLFQTQMRNMREMQKIQPQMAKLRERFKDDQVALQKEMMELYRRHRVNPLSGCLPMVLQIPIFVGLYNALMHAIELRHAPFAFWIKDLSAPDRLMVAGVGIPVLTLLMGASMFLQQRLTPQQGDPTQQKMMMFMPLVFTFMFINFPAGLVLYWLVNNLLSIGQQYLMLRSST